MSAEERYELALYRILRSSRFKCEKDTSGLGACFRNHLRTASTTGSVDQVCDACLAAEALQVFG